MASKNMYAVTDCSSLNALTVDEVYKQSMIGTDGHVFAVFACVDEEYDSTINCYNKEYTCYDAWPHNSDIPWVSVYAMVDEIFCFITVLLVSLLQ